MAPEPSDNESGVAHFAVPRVVFANLATVAGSSTVIPSPACGGHVIKRKDLSCDLADHVLVRVSDIAKEVRHAVLPGPD